MNKLLPLLVLGFLTGCTSVINTGDKIERALTPPDAVNYATTRPEGGFSTQINDSRFGNKLELLAARKSKTAGGFTQVQFDLRNGSYLGQTANISFEWLAADGSVTERQGNWMVTPLEPGALTTVTATALKSTSAECRLRVIAR
ncbi:MAG: hypothetical protein D4R66_04570 [Opitutales bacterium]|nr:MAG: hypothetical protein D4R66_04570 [Opitutales bacterium]